MLGTVVMEIGKAEMMAAIEFYLNRNVLNVTLQSEHRAIVTKVQQRSSGRFVIEFDGQPEPEWPAQIGEREVKVSR